MDKQQVIMQENLHSFNYLKNCKKEFIIATILEEFTDEEKKDILRNIEFINMMDSDSLNQIINSMNFTSAFNMLQNKVLIEKVNDINIKFIAKEAMFIKDFLNLIPTSKINHNMLKNMIKNCSKEDIINFLNNENIINQLHISDIIEIALYKSINLVEDVYLIELFNDNEAYEYVDGYFRSVKRPLNYNIINNDYVKGLLFDNDIDFDEVKYLYDYLTTQNNHSIKDVNHSLKAFIKVDSLYKEYGLRGTQELFNTKGITIEDVFTFKTSKKKKRKKSH